MIIIEITTHSDFAKLKLNSVFFELERDLYIGIWYIPPHDTSRVHQVHEMWSAIENEITFLQERGDVIIMGDLNARTGTKQDWAEYNDIPTFSFPKDCDDDYKIDKRVSMDHTVNSASKRCMHINWPQNTEWLSWQ